MLKTKLGRLSVSVSPDGDLHYAAMLGPGKTCGIPLVHHRSAKLHANLLARIGGTTDHSLVAFESTLNLNRKEKPMAVKPSRKTSRRVPASRKKSGRVVVAVSSDSTTGVAKVSFVSVLRKRLKITQSEFARLVPMSQRSLATLESGTPPTPMIARRLTELKRLIDALSEIVQEESLGTWMQQPNDAFDGLKPMEVIDRGHSDRLWEMIFNLRSGNPS